VGSPREPTKVTRFFFRDLPTDTTTTRPNEQWRHWTALEDEILRRTLLAIFAASILTPCAWAVETQPATDFDGVYDITYTAVGFDLHLCVNGQCLSVGIPAVGDQLTQADVDNLHDEVEDACYDQIDPAVCDWLVDYAVGAIQIWLVAVANQLPETAEVTVDPNPIYFFWWNTGLHGSTWDLTSEVQDPFTLDFTGEVYESWFGAMLDNNDGDHDGNFYAVGLAFGGIGVGNGIACVPAGAAAVAANVDRDAGYAMEGAFAVDVEIVCLLTDGVHWAVANLGIAEAAAFEGSRW
jgi:hypothetical protein